MQNTTRHGFIGIRQYVCKTRRPQDPRPKNETRSLFRTFLVLFSLFISKAASADAADETRMQADRAAEVQRGSETAKGGFQNEDEVRDKFNNWMTDDDARAWLSVMKYSLGEITEVAASKPHGQKADVEVRVKTKRGERVEGISIKLVSNPNGFNQIDKRWLATYAKQWNMPAEVHEALKCFVGETPPTKSSRDDARMFLNELDEKSQKAVVEFFAQHREVVVADLFRGDGAHASDWMMVTLKDCGSGRMLKGLEKDSVVNNRPQWTLYSTANVIRFYGEGEIRITSAGSLRIGRITMQRKGGDNGRESAKMLQFKINPAELFSLADAPITIEGGAKKSH